jgi:GTPase SAR1 family protein
MSISINELVAVVRNNTLSSFNVSNTERNSLFITNEDFSRTDPSLKRLVVVGCCGSGKSTLLNKLSGFKLEWNEEHSMFMWDSTPIFESKSHVNSVTKHTTYAIIDSFHYKNGLLVVDTPGHDHRDLPNVDSKEVRDKLAEDATDLYDKLKRMGHLNTILVLHNDVHSNRLNPATFTLLQKIDEMFADTDKNIWDHVVIAYSKCDGDTNGWKSNLDEKCLELQREIKSKFPKCPKSIPIYTLSGVELGNESVNYKDLSEFINSQENLETNKLVKFKGLDVRLEHIIVERDLQQRMLNARLYFNVIMFQFTLFVICILFRNIAMSFWNFSGPYDEIFLLLLFIYLIGPVKFNDWVVILWNDYMEPHLRELITSCSYKKID